MKFIKHIISFLLILLQLSFANAFSNDELSIGKIEFSETSKPNSDFSELPFKENYIFEHSFQEFVTHPSVSNCGGYADLVEGWKSIKYCGDDELAKLATNLEELDVVAKNADQIAAVGGYKVWKNASIPNLTPTDLAKLRGNQFAHTLERHGFEVSDDLLKRRATEGIAPDGSSIAKKQGNQRIGNVIPPMPSKFKDAASMKKALNAVDENTEAFQNALAAKQASTGAELPPRFSFQVELDEVVGYGFKRPEGTPNYVLTGQTLPGEPILVNGLNKIEVRYSFDQTSGKYIINTMFPIQ